MSERPGIPPSGTLCIINKKGGREITDQMAVGGSRVPLAHDCTVYCLFALSLCKCLFISSTILRIVLVQVQYSVCACSIEMTGLNECNARLFQNST
jgi:hypothetical protein